MTPCSEERAALLNGDAIARDLLNLIAERDRARDIAVAFERENAHLREIVTAVDAACREMERWGDTGRYSARHVWAAIGDVAINGLGDQ